MKKIETAIIIGRKAFDLSIDARADIPGIWGRLLARLLSFTSLIAYNYAIRNGEK